MSSYPHIAVWVGNVPHALPKRALVEVLASLAGSNFVPPANVVMTHRGTFVDSEYSHAMMYFWNQSAAELAVSLLNNYYSEHLGTRLLARLAQPGTAETKAKAALVQAEHATSRAIAANKAAADAVANAMQLERLRLQEQSTVQPPPLKKHRLRWPRARRRRRFAGRRRTP